MSIETGTTYMPSAIAAPEIRTDALPALPNTRTETGSIQNINWSALLQRAQERSYSLTPLLHLEDRPLEPLEPKPYSLSEEDWNKYAKQRDAARAYEAENSLRGTF